MKASTDDFYNHFLCLNCFRGCESFGGEAEKIRKASQLDPLPKLSSHERSPRLRKLKLTSSNKTTSLTKWCHSADLSKAA